jgi:hypothetical protein
MSKEAMKLALEALRTCDVVDYQQDFDSKKVNKAITALREALAEQPAQPLTPDLEADTGYSRDERAAFTAGWEAAEAAHGITKGAK